MAKALRDITPKVKAGPPKGEKQDRSKDHIDYVAIGERGSKVSDGSIGKMPGVDYMPKDEMGQEFVKAHKVEKHEDRVGNGDEVYKGKTKKVDMKKHGYDSPADQKVYEAKGMKCESCGTMYEGDSCGCGGKPEAKPGKKGMIYGGKKLQEVLTKKTPVSKVISDFVNSDNPKFAGKSTKERQKMALGAYYSMHPEKSKKKIKEDLAMPMLEDGKKKKMKKESAPSDTPMRFPSGNVGDTGRV